jgi:hypothetical protein
MPKKLSGHVILSGAKDLLLFSFRQIKQMLRCAQHDRYSSFDPAGELHWLNDSISQSLND